MAEPRPIIVPGLSLQPGELLLEAASPHLVGFQGELE